MLERIVNITAGSDYKQSSRPAKQSQTSRTFESFHSTANDSISLSPATSFLSVINWKLKKFKKEKERLLLEFFFDEFDFLTSFLLSDITQMHAIDYEISFISVSFINKNQIYLKVSVPFSYDPQETIQLKKGLPGLRGFLLAVVAAHGFSNMVSAENYDIQIKFSDMESELLAELDYINRCLLNFLDKYLMLKISSKIEVTKDRNKLELKFLKLIKM